MCDGRKVARTGRESGEGWSYDGGSLTLIVRTRPVDAGKPVEILVTRKNFDANVSDAADGFRETIARLHRAAGIINSSAWPNDWAPDVLVDAEQTGNRLSIHPENMGAELSA